MPIRLQQTSSSHFDILWDDGHQGPVPLKVLRDACPCAGCKGETVLFQTYVPPPVDESSPGRYDVRSAEMIGGYAIKFTWGDGHNVGLYTYDYLRSLCGCAECSKRRS